MPSEVYYGTIDNPFDPQQEAAKRNEILNRIKSWWGNLGSQTPALPPEVERRFKAATQGIIPTWLQGVGGQPQPQAPGAAYDPNEMDRVINKYQSGQTPPPAYDIPQPQPQGAPMGPPPMMPQAPPPGPPPPQQPLPQQQMAGTPGVDPVAYMQQQEQARQEKHMQMVQMVNSILAGQQGDEKAPSRKEKIANALIPLSAMLSQFGGAMMTPPWARGQMMANMGNILPEYMMAQQRTKAAREDKREQRQSQLLGHLLPVMMKEGKETTPHFFRDRAGNWQVVPGQITQERAPSTYQAMSIMYREQGNNEMADYYDRLYRQEQEARLAQERERTAQGWVRVGQGQQRLDRPQMLYDTEQDQLIQAPPGTRPLPRQRQGAGGSDALAEYRGGGGTAVMGQYPLKDAQGRVRMVDKATYDAYMKHYGINQ